MKLILLSLFTFLTSFTFAQLTVSYVEFYSWTSNDNVQYTTMFVLDDYTEDGMSDALIRVKYTMGGLTKIAEFTATALYEVQEDSLDMLVRGDETASFVKGSGSYTPDNFILTFDLDGNFIDAFQADHNELARGEDAYLASMNPVYPEDSDHLRNLIKEFYTSSDTLYRDLMTYASQFD